MSEHKLIINHTNTQHNTTDVVKDAAFVKQAHRWELEVPVSCISCVAAVRQSYSGSGLPAHDNHILKAANQAAMDIKDIKIFRPYAMYIFSGDIGVSIILIIVGRSVYLGIMALVSVSRQLI